MPSISGIGTNREDWAISEQSYLGISSRGYLPGPYSEREKQLWEFDQFVLSLLTAAIHGSHGTSDGSDSFVDVSILLARSSQLGIQLRPAVL